MRIVREVGYGASLRERGAGEERAFTGQEPCRLALRKGPQIGQQADRIATALSDGEVGPAAGLDVDLERAQVAVVAPRIAGHPFMADQPTVREPALQEHWQDRECR